MINPSKIKYIVVIGLCAGGTILSAQSTFNWLNAAPSPRSFALAGANVADASMVDGAGLNPASIVKIIGRGNKVFSFGIHKLQVDIAHKYLSYAKPFGLLGLGFEIRHMDYGTFDEYDYQGNYEGRFIGGDILIRSTVAARVGERLSIGITSGVITSILARKLSISVLWSAGVTLDLPAIDATLAGVVQNRGAIVNYYGDSEEDELPEIWLVGVSKKLAYLPLVIHLAGGQDVVSGDPLVRLGGEFSIGEAIKLRFGVDQDKLGFSRQNYVKDILAGISVGAGTQFMVNRPGGQNMSIEIDSTVKFMGPLGMTLVFGLSFLY